MDNRIRFGTKGDFHEDQDKALLSGLTSDSQVTRAVFRAGAANVAQPLLDWAQDEATKRSPRTPTPVILMAVADLNLQLLASMCAQVLPGEEAWEVILAYQRTVLDAHFMEHCRKVHNLTRGASKPNTTD